MQRPAPIVGGSEGEMITLRDILKLNPFITLLELDIRDPDTRLLKQVIIGKNYNLSTHEWHDEQNGRLKYIDVDINKHGRPDKRGFSEIAYDIDWKAIPKIYLDMEVDLIHSIGSRYGVNTGMKLWASVIPTQMTLDLEV